MVIIRMIFSLSVSSLKRYIYKKCRICVSLKSKSASQ